MKRVIQRLLCLLGFHKWCGLQVGHSLLRRCLACGKKRVELRLFLVRK